MNLLLVRTDRLGDAVLSAPAAAAIKAVNPQHRVSFLVRAYTAPVYRAASGIDELLIDEDNGLKSGGSWRAFFRLLARVRRRRFDAAVLLHAEFRPALLLFLAGIPLRLAPASKIWQGFANWRVRQRRSLCRCHELEYNLELVRALVPGLPHREPELQISLPSGGESGGIIIHPGCGGSARNGSPEFYRNLAAELVRRGRRVQISWGPGEQELAGIFRGMAGVFVPEQPLPLPQLLETIARADVFISGSTGPLHLAAALGRPTVSLFCPIRVCTPIRWGPRPADRAAVWMPPRVPPCERCSGNSCPYWDCMERITTDDVLQALPGIEDMS